MRFSEEYKHGIIWQDVQHEQLLKNIKKLSDSQATGVKNKENFYKTIQFIKEYINAHFGIEELYMKKHGYPGTKKHIEVHQYFIASFEKFIDQSIYSEKESVKLLNRLTKWFVGHIQTTDKDLAEFLLKARKV